MGLGLTRASIISAVCDDTGDDSNDAIVKVRRLVNRRGQQFMKLAPWPFERENVSFNITTAASYYSGASYLPATFKKVLSAFIYYNNRRYPLTEVGILEKDLWPSPDDNAGIPSEFCITRVESDYWQINFDRIPDQTYTVYFEIEKHWVDLTADTSETLVTKDYYDAFVHYCVMGRLKQQGDIEQYQIYKDEWWNPMSPQSSILGQILADLSNASMDRGVIMDPQYMDPFGGIYEDNDYKPEGIGE